MYSYQHYGIALGQHYVPADGGKNLLIVVDVDTYKDCGDVVVYDTAHATRMRIDAFKLAKVRYNLVDQK